MNCKQFKQLYGIPECRKVAEQAGTKYEYFHHVACGRNMPSVDWAKRIQEASAGRIRAEDVLGL